MSRSTGVRRLAVVSALALGCASLGVVPAARAAEPGQWRVVKVNDFGEYDWMSPVGAAGRHNAWTFVHSDDGKVAQHWNGRTWRDVLLPAGLPGWIRGVSTPSAASAWAVGDSDSASRGSYALRWNGREWVVAHKWEYGIVSDVTAVRSGEAWVFSDHRRDAGVGIWHFDGRRWKQVQLPYSLERASAVSARDIWAIGNDATDSFKVIAHYDGKAWTQVPADDALPDDVRDGEGQPIQQVFLRDVVAVSAKEIWVTGYLQRYDSLSGYESFPIVARWDGQRWRKVDVPGKWEPSNAAPDGRGGLWLSGEGEPREAGRNAPVLMHRSADSTWSSAAGPVEGRDAYVDDMVLIPGTTSLWGTGQLRPADGSSSDGAIFRQGPK